MVTVPVILAGGIGERFWPLSRSSSPKQLLPLISSKTMLEETLRRVYPLCKKDVKPLIITGKTIAGRIRKVLPPALSYDCIVEPVGKNTAPAIALAAAWIEKKYGSAVMIILSADHDIKPKSAFLASMRAATRYAAGNDSLVVFGIRPTRVETGYGYLHSGAKLAEVEGETVFRVRKFIEKPTAAKAAIYFKRNVYFWNSGMFVWRTSVILDEFKTHLPDLYKLTKKAGRKCFSVKAIGEFYRDAEKVSIDYGIMEQSARVAMIAAGFSWDDVGSFEALSRIHEQSPSGVTSVGKQIHEFDCSDSIIYNGSSACVTAVGMENAVVIATDDAVLVIDRSKVPDIKTYLTALKKKKGVSTRLF